MLWRRAGKGLLGRRNSDYKGPGGFVAKIQKARRRVGKIRLRGRLRINHAQGLEALG